MSSGDLNGSPDVVVVGGGAIGAATAYELTRRGARVMLLERSGDPSGCSFGNAGLICPSHADALASPASVRDGLAFLARRDGSFRIRPRPALLPWLARFGAASLPRRSARATAVLRTLAATSLELHAGLARAGLATGFARRGTLSVFESAHSLARARAGPPPANGARFLDAREARGLALALAPGIAGALLHPGDAHCDPGDLVTRCSAPHGSRAPRSAPAWSSCGCGAATAGSPGSIRRRAGSGPERSCWQPARGRARWRARSA